MENVSSPMTAVLVVTVMEAVAIAAETSPMTMGTAVVATPTLMEKENATSPMTATLLVTVMEVVTTDVDPSPVNIGEGRLLLGVV